MSVRISKSSNESPRLGIGGRVWAAVIALGLVSPLVVGVYLTPDARGHGTHTQLGLYPCAWASTLGWPCPTCGMTTSFTFAAHGHIWDSLRTQPMGAFLSLVCAAGFWLGMHAAVFGSQVGRVVSRVLRPWVWWSLGGLMLAAWGYKIATWQT